MVERDVSYLETAPLRCAEHCRFVTGAKRAAIYDLESGNVYSLNESAKRTLLGEIEDSFNFFQKLEKMGFLESSNLPPAEIRIEIPHVGLEFMWFELTSKCNERCIHCYASTGESLLETEELSVGEWQQAIGEGAALNCKRLQFIGGEPLLFRGIFDLATAAKDLDYNFVEIFTNGLLLNEERVKKIKDLSLHIAVSLYSIVPEIHDAITQVPGSFQKTWRSLEMLKEARVPTRIGVIVMRQNQDTISETLEKLREMELYSGGVDVIRPTGRGSCAELLPEGEILQTWALMTKPSFSTSREKFVRNHYWNNCWAGKIAITAEGGVMPCIFAREHIVANVEQGLEEAVNKKELQNLWKITKNDIEECQDCEYRYTCHDCRPLAEDTTGNLYAKNPRCVYNPYSGEWKEEI